MDVIRHHHPRTKVIEMPFKLAEQDGMGDDIGDAGIVQPFWSNGVTVQSAILRSESVPRRWVTREIRLGGQGSPQTPGEEDIATVRVEMR